MPIPLLVLAHAELKEQQTVHLNPALAGLVQVGDKGSKDGWVFTVQGITKAEGGSTVTFTGGLPLKA